MIQDEAGNINRTDRRGMAEKKTERIALFDIDGTILYAGKTPAMAILRAISEVYGVGDLMPLRREYSFAGKTDPQIVTDLLRMKGYPADEIENSLEKVFERYIFYLKTLMTSNDGARLYPGIVPLLERLDADDNVILGLLTGNIEAGDRIKLGRFGLEGLFEIGAYGSDSPDRDRLPRLLLEKLRSLTGRSYEGEDMVIIGDSVYDIRCSRTVGALTIAVATGTTPPGDLLNERPDHLFSDFSETNEVVEKITGGG